jgi:hypothetical protein
MTANTMTLNVHFREGTSATFNVVGSNITQNFTHDPDAAKGVAVPDTFAGPLVNLALHKIDLIRAKRFLEEIVRLGGVQPGQAMSTACAACWEAALVATMKCFQKSDARAEKLDKAKIFTDQTVRDAFEDLMELRNQHIVHDGNDWMQAIPYAVVTKRGHNPAVNDVDCVVIEGVETAHIDLFRKVVDTALTWVQTEFGKLRESIRGDLAKWDHDDLMALPLPTTKTPTAGSIGQTRPKR